MASMATTTAPLTCDPMVTAYDVEAYTERFMAYLEASPSSYHAADQAARRLHGAGFSPADETLSWTPDLPRRGYVRRDGALIAWMLPESLHGRAGVRIVGAHTDSPALKLKPRAAVVRDGLQILGVEVYGGPLLNSFLDRELGLAGRLVTREGAIHLVRTPAVARIAQVAPHLDRSVNESLHLDRQAHLAPLWAVAGDAAGPDDPERYLCEVAGIDPAELLAHDVVTFPVQDPARFGRRGELLAAARLDNLSSVHAALTALELMARERVEVSDPVVFVANDHEEVGSQTRSGAAGPFLESVLQRLLGVLAVTGDARHAVLARSICVSADAAHAAHPAYGQLHDPVVRPILGAGPVLKLNAQQRYATDAVGAAAWARACTAAGVESQNFVSNNAVPCGSTIGPITASRLGITTVDVGQALLSMHSQREMCAVADGPMLARALHAFWLGSRS